MPRRVRKPKGPSRSTLSGLIFPVGRINRILKKGNFADRISSGAPVYLAGVLEYVIGEVVEYSGKVAKECQKTRINPRHIFMAVQNDEELHELFKNVTIAEGGVIPGIQKELLPQFKKKSKKDIPAAASTPEVENQENDGNQDEANNPDQNANANDNPPDPNPPQNDDNPPDPPQNDDNPPDPPQNDDNAPNPPLQEDAIVPVPAGDQAME